MGTQNDITLINQFGEKSINALGSVSKIPLPAQATLTMLGNFTGGSAVPAVQTTQQVANKLPAKTGVTAISAQGADSAQSIAITTAGGNTYTDAAVNAAVNAALTVLNTQLNAIITQNNAILAALKVVS